MLKILRDDLNPFHYTLLLMFILSLILFSKLSYNGIPNYDDAYYAVKAKEILKTGDIWVMKFNGKPKFDNTPMHMWLMALMFKIFGVNEYAARFSSALFTILLIYLIFITGKLIFNEWIGFFSSFVLSTSFFITKYSLRAMTDITLSLFFVLSILFFILGIKKNQNYFLLSGVMIGFAILTKSVFGFFPLITIGLFLLIEKRFDILLSPRFILMIIIAFAVSSPWFIINYLQYKESFIDRHFKWLLISRSIGGKVRDLKNHLHYIKIIFSYGLPWLPVALYGSWVLIKKRLDLKEFNFWILPVIWAWLIVIILSFAYEKKSWYIMPTFFAGTLICGYLLSDWVKDYKKFADITVTIYFICMILIVILPIDIKAKKSNEIKKIVPVIKQIVPEKEEVINFKQDYWAHICYFFFYTDRPLSLPYYNIEEVIQKLKSTHTLCYTHKIDFNNYAKNYTDELKIIGYFNDYILFCNKEKWNKIGLLFDIPKEKKISLW